MTRDPGCWAADSVGLGCVGLARRVLGRVACGSVRLGWHTATSFLARGRRRAVARWRQDEKQVTVLKADSGSSARSRSLCAFHDIPAAN